ncbi:MAG: hypothetical protein LKF37_10060 [Lentilactobacillus diolivorans]|jgi:hypothetical protein|nr:hypothetical protein [Lentilactobacillus diolivorans]
MKLKGSIAGLVTVSFIGAGLLLDAQQVNAASWHKGAPDFLKGSWRTKKYKLQGQKYRDHFFASDKGFGMVFAGGTGFGVTKSMKYKFLGNHTYKLVNHYAAGSYGNTKIKVSENKRVLHLRGDSHLFYKISNKLAQY